MIDRYSLSKMSRIWSDEHKMEIMLKIEVLSCEAMTKLGVIPKAAMDKIRKNAKFDLEEVRRLEERTKHDVVAFIQSVGQSLGPEAQYLHMGMTSSDLLDTSLSLQCVEAGEILVSDVKKLLAALKEKAKKYKDAVCIARTHGVHAEPTTFGLKMAIWYDEMNRNFERLQAAIEGMRYGKLSGAVGTYANIDPSVEEYVCQQLNLKPANVATQVISRDPHAHYIMVLAIIGSSLEKFATEIRALQKTELLEVEEPFFKGQIGSSAMPHKRNPVTCERICGLSRILRANSIVAMENINLWHERDISHSSAERVILPDSTIALNYMLNKFIPIIEGLLVYPKNMIANLSKTRGLIYSQRILLELMKKGLTRDAAYEIIQAAAMQVWQESTEFKDVLFRDRRVRKYLSQNEINACFDIKYYIRYRDKIFKQAGINKIVCEGDTQKMKKLEKIYEGKAKILYTTEDPTLLIQYFKDDATAFNAQKKGTIAEKGIMNNRIAAKIFEYLKSEGIESHFVELLNDREMLVKRVAIVPLEVIIRNRAAGSLCRLLGLTEGTKLACPTLEFCFKDDALGDPQVNEYHIRALQYATDEEVRIITATAFRINEALKKFFLNLKIELIDFKLEFGRIQKSIILADEISPDTCRLWEVGTGNKLDKDRFRRDLGNIEEAYQEVLRRVSS